MHELGGLTINLHDKFRHSPIFSTALIDNVHVRAAGADWYAEHASAFIDVCSATPRRADVQYSFKGGEFRWVPLGGADTFERAGFTSPFVTLPDGKSSVFDFATPAIVNGVSFLMGPETGRVTLEFEDTRKRSVVCYDQFCYYTRVQLQLLTPQKTSRVVVSAGGEMPEIKLKKGEPFQGARSARPIAFLCTSEPVADIANRARPCSVKNTELLSRGSQVRILPGSPMFRGQFASLPQNSR